MNHIKTIGMLVLAVSAIMAAATFALPSMTMDAHAQACGSSSAAVVGSGSTSATASQSGPSNNRVQTCTTGSTFSTTP